MRLAPFPAVRADHDYQLCDDPDCPRYPCRVYKEGWLSGQRAGYNAGYGDGYADGHSAGFDAGAQDG